jgi:hypothetical protein
MPVAIFAAGVAATSGGCSQPVHIVGISETTYLLTHHTTFTEDTASNQSAQAAARHIRATSSLQL